MSAAGSGIAPIWMIFGGVAIAAGVGAGAFFLRQPDNVTPQAVPAAMAPAVPESAPEEVAEAAPEPEAPDTPAEPIPDPGPVIEEVRVEADGLAVFAGKAAALGNVVLRLDGAEIARASADTAGAFATVAFLSPSDAPRVLTVARIKEDGSEVLGGDELILAPVVIETPEPEVASAEPTPAPESEPDVVVSEPAAKPAAEVVEAELATEPEPEVAAVEPAPKPEPVPDVAKTDLEPAPEPEPQVAAIQPEAEPQAAQIEPTTEPQSEPKQAEEVVAEADPQPEAAPTPETQNAVAEESQPDVTPVPDVAVAAAPVAEPTVSVESTAQDEPVPAPEPVATAEAVADAPEASDTSAPVPVVQDQIASLSPAAVAPAAQVSSGAAATSTTTRAAPAKAPTALAVIRSNADGVSVVQPATPSPEVMSQVALDTISYSVAGDVQLAGRAQSEAQQIRVYLDNEPIATLDVTSAGAWRGALPDVDTGVYTLRIDEVDDTGAVTSRIETPFKREDPEVLNAVTDASGGPVRSITVQEGNTLWAIARDRYGEGTLYLRVFEANRSAIRDPDLIYPGQVFALPED